ncbi:Addiction module component, CHP02574 [bacterium]|nr:Addiction module component, CHP02574 [bacterium]
MAISKSELQALTSAEKLSVIEFLWDDLTASPEPWQLPEWIRQEADRRRAEMDQPDFGLTHDEVWSRIDADDE